MKVHEVHLSKEERNMLESIVARIAAQLDKKEKPSRRELRAQILLDAARSYTDKEIAHIRGTSIPTVERTRRLYCEQGLKAVLERK